MPRFHVGLRRVVTLSTAFGVTAATEAEARASAAQRALAGELSWQIQDDHMWQNDCEEAQVVWIEEA